MHRMELKSWLGFGGHEQVLNNPCPEEGSCLHRAAYIVEGVLSYHSAARNVATSWINTLRAQPPSFWTIEGLLQNYPLDSAEGIALMRLAESLLRTRDASTRQQLLSDKLEQGDWVSHAKKHPGISQWMDKILSIASRIEDKESVQPNLLSHLGDASIRKAAEIAVKKIGEQFVIGETLPQAISKAAKVAQTSDTFSFDMLGEGARTQADANRYFAAYVGAIEHLAHTEWKGNLRPSISIKLSAIHPRFEDTQRTRVLNELVPKLLTLCEMAAQSNSSLTIDAEESERLVLTADVFVQLIHQLNDHPKESVRQWHGLGIAVQAYQRRALGLIEMLIELANKLERTIEVRLVKGAYWDAEIARAQQLGLQSYPVFTTKAATDLNYLACARLLLDARPHIYPMLATHNALTLATILEYAERDPATHSGFDFEIQRLYGMGEALIHHVRSEHDGWGHLPCRIYAPVGLYEDALAYLVRRLLENGANSSFVHALNSPEVRTEDLAQDPYEHCQGRLYAPNEHIPDPVDLFPDRKNSAGRDITQRAVQQWLTASIAHHPLGKFTKQLNQDEPSHSITEATKAAHHAFKEWTDTDVDIRATALERWASQIEHHIDEAVALLVQEARKTYQDSLAEVREAIDFLRYYASQARTHFAQPKQLPSPTGETNTLYWRGRGVWACISPWNFPLAIFIGQISAALASGNTVVAKPAPQTPAIAHWAARLAHMSGIPQDALQLVEGDAQIGNTLVSHPFIAGVAFTGSTKTAKAIALTLAQRRGPIIPLIAETGGVNVMIADATALPEQVCDAAIESAFRSAGQRCSALRILFIQEDIADRVIELIHGALKERRTGPTENLDTDIGSLIDTDAVLRVSTAVETLKQTGNIIYQHPYQGNTAPAQWFSPTLIEMPFPGHHGEETFGPVLQIVRFQANQYKEVLDAVARSGWGLTLGLHSRIDARVRELYHLPVGNVYVNRSIIGATVGVQPFGGEGLSGTGPKAGGPHTLFKFATERLISINSAAAGGNVQLLMQIDTNTTQA